MDNKKKDQFNFVQKPEPEKIDLFNKPQILEWIVMFLLTFLWAITTHFVYILQSKITFPLYSPKQRTKFRILRIIAVKILIFTLFIYSFEGIITPFIINNFITYFQLTPQTKTHFLAASLGITLGLFSGLKLRLIIK